MLEHIDRWLDRFTMYRFLLYYLIILVVIATGYSAAGILHFSATALVVSTLILVITCWVSNKFFSIIMDVPSNVESSHITALILALIIAPMTSYTTINIGFLLAAGGLAMASKYLLAINKKHMFNPAAIAVVLTALGPKQSASWWIGTSAMLPFVVIGGVLLVRKIRHGRMVAGFFAATLLATAFYTALAHGDVGSALHKTILTSAMFFLGFVMLTEPLTTPPTAGKQTWYAVLVGALFPPQVHLLSLYSTPELALSAGNIFSYLLSPKRRLFPRLQQKVRLTTDSIDFIFTPGQKISYVPGQYMEWMLPHAGTDNRGNRRYFTLASSPTESDLRIGVKFYQKNSSYKRALLQASKQTPIIASQLAGDFVLPKDASRKLAFIAGGIGITPYRSMIKYLIDTNQSRDIRLLYSGRTPQDFTYQDVFEQARQQFGLETTYIVTGKSATANGPHQQPGHIDARLIRERIPDYTERTFYISGTQAMVSNMKSLLLDLGIPHRHIKTDFFSGYS